MKKNKSKFRVIVAILSAFCICICFSACTKKSDRETSRQMQLLDFGLRDTHYRQSWRVKLLKNFRLVMVKRELLCFGNVRGKKNG